MRRKDLPGYIIIICILYPFQIHGGTLLEETYRHDKSLNNVYEEYIDLLPSKDQIKIKKQQKAWVITRNRKCNIKITSLGSKGWLSSISSDVKKLRCVIDITKARTSELVYRGKEYIKKKSKYPPYPDAWDMILPETKYKKRIRFYKTGDGDILIAYSQVNKKANIWKYIKFFSRKQGNVNIARIGFRFLPISLTKRFKITREREIYIWWKNYYSNRRCPGLIDQYFIIKNKETEKKVSLLYYLDQPIEEEISDMCVDVETESTSVLNKFSSIYEGMIPLRDKTFLVYMKTSGILLRLTYDLKTKSKLLNKRFYWVDREEIDKIWDTAVTNKKLSKGRPYKYMYDSLEKKLIKK